LAALWFWKNRKGLSDAAKAGNIDKASYLINGGTNGLEDRRMKYQQYLGMFNDGVLDTNDVSTDDAKTEPTPAPGADAPSQVAANVPGGNDNSGVAGPATTASLSDPASGSPNMTTSFSEPATTPAPQQSSVSSASSAAAPAANMNTSFREPTPAPASAPSSDGSGQTNTILSSIHDVLSQMLTVLQNSSNAPSGGTGAQAKPAQKNSNPANSSMNIGMDRSFS
jgi:predicted component of type VI protein secretion system